MFDFDAGKERLSILSKYVRLPRSAEHGEVTASLLYERLVMAAIAASKRIWAESFPSRGTLCVI